MITSKDFDKWYDGIKLLFSLDNRCEVYFYNELLFVTTETETIEQLKNVPEHFMRVLFKQKFGLNN